MSYYLGLHINDNYIKYAKVKIEDNKEPKIKVYGVDFYDNLQLALDRIIGETYSFDVEISINLKDESYYNFEVFSGMNYANLKKHISLIFAEEVCVKNNYSASSFETRFVKVKNDLDQDSTKVIYIAVNKSNLVKIKQLLKSKAKKILPLSFANLSLINGEQHTNYAILDIDSVTTLTIVVKGSIKDVITINLGMDNILDKMKKIYKTYAKSYAQCKNIILMNEGVKALFAKKSIDTENNNDSANSVDDSELVTPILFEIVEKINDILKQYVGVVNKVYLTGSAVIINNIDLYFEDALNDISVELLKPYFIGNDLEVSQKAKEMIEVNSAIALAIASDTVGSDSINFAKKAPINMQALLNNKVVSTVMPKILEIKNKIMAKIPKNKKNNDATSNESKKKVFTNIKSKVANIISKKNHKKDTNTLINEKENQFISKIKKVNDSISITTPRLIISVLLFIFIAYSLTIIMINNKYQSSINEVDLKIGNMQSVISNIDSDISYINNNKQKYKTLEENIKTLLSQLNEVNGLVNDIPSFLTRIALIIPDEVVITSISIDNNIAKIEAQSQTYAPLGFFISGLKEEEIMSNITTKIKEDSELQQVVVSGVVK